MCVCAKSQHKRKAGSRLCSPVLQQHLCKCQDLGAVVQAGTSSSLQTMKLLCCCSTHCHSLFQNVSPAFTWSKEVTQTRACTLALKPVSLPGALWGSSPLEPVGAMELPSISLTDTPAA